MKISAGRFSEVASCLKFLKKYILRYRQTVLCFSASWGLEGILNLLLPILTGILIDQMVYYKDIQVFRQIALFILGIGVFWCLIYFIIYTHCNHILGRYTFDIKMDLIDKLLQVSLEDFLHLQQGDVVNTIQLHTAECVKILTNNLIYTIYSGGTVLFLCVYIFMQNWVIGLIAVLFSLLSAYVTILGSGRVSKVSSLQKEQYGRYLGWLNGVFYGLRDIHFLLAQDQIQKRFSDMVQELNRTKNKKDRAMLIAANLSELLNLGMQLVIFGACAFYIAKGDMTLGTFTVINIFFGSLTQNLVWLNGYYVDIKDRASYINYIKRYMELPDEETTQEPIEITEGRVVVSDLSFSYQNGRPLIRNLSLAVEPGEKLALVGKSGCGKSTLLGMIAGAATPQSGYIAIDGQRIDRCSKSSLRRQVGIIHQRSVLFDDTIRENIRLGNKKASEEQIVEACRMACIWDWISSLPDGLDTMVHGKGAGLSEGQKQRLAIARIYLKNDRVLIFDEATSSVDASLERGLTRQWSGRHFQDKTLLVISHRLETVKACDRVAIMDEGRIVGLGKTEEIVESPLFRNIFS